MKFAQYSFSALALSLGLLATPAIATSFATSLAAESLNQSVGSLSNSLSGSSKSSQTNQAAAGDYQLIQVAATPARPGFVQLTLRNVTAQDAKDDVLLTLPQKAFDTSGLAQGNTITAREHSYGLEFANAQTRATFFLVMNDAAYRELASNPVAL